MHAPSIGGIGIFRCLTESPPGSLPVSSSYDPNWMETVFLLVNSLDDSLILIVYDHHGHWKNTVLGSATFHLSCLAGDRIQGGIHPSLSKDGKNKGDLMLDVIYHPVMSIDEDQDSSELIHLKRTITQLKHCHYFPSNWYCPSDHPPSEKF
jgi:Ca2+-dependent lipid-binding protein